MCYRPGMTDFARDLDRAEHLLKVSRRVTDESPTRSALRTSKLGHRVKDLRPFGHLKETNDMALRINKAFHQLKQDLVGDYLDLEVAALYGPKASVTHHSDSAWAHVHPSQAARERRDKALALAYLKTELSQEELNIFRVPVAYRLVRTLTALAGRLEPGQMLSEGLRSLEEWNVPLTDLTRVDPQDLWRFAGVGLVLPYLSQRVPVPIFLTEDTPAEGLCNLEFAFEALNRCLGFDRGTSVCPALGSLGCHELIEFFPSPLDLVRYEDELMGMIHGALADRGRKYVRDSMLVNGLGYSLWEANDAIVRASKVARHYAKHRDSLLDREYMIERYEGIAERANKVSAFNAEINAAKEQAKAMGINHKADTGDDDLFAIHKELEDMDDDASAYSTNHARVEKTIGDE